MLLGFAGTMDLSDTPGGPACPSRASGWVTRPPPGASRVALDLPVPTCRRHYPGGTTGGGNSLPKETCDGGLPHPFAGSAPTLPVSRPARRSLALRPVGSRSRPRRPFFLEGFGSIVTSTAAPIATGWSESCRVGIALTEDQRLSTAHKGGRFLFSLRRSECLQGIDERPGNHSDFCLILT